MQALVDRDKGPAHLAMPPTRPVISETVRAIKKQLTVAALLVVAPYLIGLPHPGISVMFENGFAIQEVSLVSGHKSWDMLRRYTNLKPESLHLHAANRDK